MKLNQRYIIITTFRDDLKFDDNFDNLIEEKIKLREKTGIKSEIVEGIYQGKIEYSLLIPFEFKLINRVKMIMTEYFQECFIDILNTSAYFIDVKGLVIKHLTWVEVTREEAIANGDFTYQSTIDKFYIAK